MRPRQGVSQPCVLLMIRGFHWPGCEIGLGGRFLSVVTAHEIATRGFDEYVRVDGDRLRRALVARFGVEIGTEAAAEALAVAWRDWDRVQPMANPTGYLFRVGQSRARPLVRWARRRHRFPDAEPSASARDSAELLDLIACLGRLKPNQRSAVVLVKCFGYSHSDVGELLDVNESAVKDLVHRGLRRLRKLMEESS